MGVLGMRLRARKVIEKGKKGRKPWGQHGFTATKFQSTKDTIADRMTLSSPHGWLG
jgi:hypothetical protein